MKLFITFIAFFFLCPKCFTQISAVTNNGDEVILYDNGTWKYADSAISENEDIKENPANFSKNNDAGFQLKSAKVKMAISFNPKKWSFEKGGQSDVAEYSFTLKGKDAYGMLISERTEIPVESLIDIAVKNARDAAPDTKIIMKEYRIVNNQKVLFMQMNGTMQGIKFSYLGYYYSNENGTVQFVTYTSQNLLGENKNEMLEFLNGFEVLN